MPPRSLIALLRLLAVSLLVAMLAVTPVGAQDDDDDDDDGTATSTAVAGDDDDDDDDGTGTAGADDDRFGAWLHTGTCDQLGDTVEDLEDLGNDDDADGADNGNDDSDDSDDDSDDDRDRVWERIGGGEEMPEPFHADDDDIDVTLDTLTAEEHVIAVHETGSADSPVLACGAVTGEPDADGGLLIELEEVDDSGYEGRAYLIADADDDDDDDNEGTEVLIGIWEVQPAGV